ncbi:MAG: hypothetical protein K0S70_580 [Microbacterium sp.]|jgi:hypothetical protein|nr:hypothetical protein [Microbacterium sp.]
MVAGGVGFAILAYFALLSAFVADACYGQCDTELLTVGWLISLFAPPVIFVSTIIWTVFRLVTRKIAWWAPLVGAAAGVTIWMIGAGMMTAAVN